MKQLKTSLISTSLVFISLFISNDLKAQEPAHALKLSLGGTIGHTLSLKHGSKSQPGLVYSVLGELQYHQLIGRIQYTLFPSSRDDENNSNRGGAILGTLGYTFPITDKVYLPVMIGGGASYINYTVSIFGSRGDSFNDVVIQAGGVLAPYYKLNDHLSITSGIRFFKSIYEFERSQKIDLVDISVGIRLTM